MMKILFAPLLLSGLTGCVDVGVPVVGGQVWSCVVSRPGVAEPLGTYEACGPWSDYRDAAQEIWDAHPEYDMMGLDMVCTGTRKACDIK